MAITGGSSWLGLGIGTHPSLRMMQRNGRVAMIDRSQHSTFGCHVPVLKRALRHTVSERTYGAVIYLRTKEEGLWTMSLVIAKTKVTSLKQVSLPLLELCATVLLMRLTMHMRNLLGNLLLAQGVRSTFGQIPW